MPPLDGEPCCTREYAKGVVKSQDAKIRALEAERDSLRQALAGIPDPARAVEAAREALRRAVREMEIDDYAPTIAFDLRAALALLTPAGETEVQHG
jgi:hypothetical protein